MCVSAWHHYTRLLTVICLLFCLCVVQLVALFEMVNKIAVSRQSSANCFHFVGQQQQQQPIWQAITVNITVKIYSRYTRTHSHTLTLTQWLTHCNYATQLKLKNHTPAIAHLFDFKCTIAQCVMRGGGNPTNQSWPRLWQILQFDEPLQVYYSLLILFVSFYCREFDWGRGWE